MMMACNMYNSSEKDILLFVHLCTQNRNTRIDRHTHTERERERKREMLLIVYSIMKDGISRSLVKFSSLCESHYKSRQQNLDKFVTIRRVPEDDINDDDAIYHPHEQLVHDHDHDHDAP